MGEWVIGVDFERLVTKVFTDRGGSAVKILWPHSPHTKCNEGLSWETKKLFNNTP
jgi:hypothetical protein